MFHSLFYSLGRSRYSSFFSLSFRFILWSAGTAKSTILQIFFLLLIIMRSGLLAGIRWSVCMLKSHRSLCVSFSRTGAGLCIYHLFVWSNWNFLHISQLWLALYSFCANLLHYYYYCCCCCCSLIRAFHISDSRWFFTEVWVTASLLKSPGLFLVFWQFSTMLSFGWSPLVRQPPSPLVSLVIP